MMDRFCCEWAEIVQLISDVAFNLQFIISISFIDGNLRQKQNIDNFSIDVMKFIISTKNMKWVIFCALESYCGKCGLCYGFSSYI